MARIPDLKRVAVEDFAREDQPLVNKLAFIINSFHEQVRSALSGNLDFTNINQELKTINFVTGTNGQPLNPVSFNSTLTKKVEGIIVVRAIITTNNLAFQDSAPFISWSQNDNSINITYIGGLLPNTGYQLSLLTL